mmetsp:Transcript_23067/g.60976  ORF Transcript_23067/g.60976 Transcript_23067/m.60976 type:complete len:100 (+) Transcript_23067:221-520(+)
MGKLNDIFQDPDIKLHDARHVDCHRQRHSRAGLFREQHQRERLGKQPWRLATFPAAEGAQQGRRPTATRPTATTASRLLGCERRGTQRSRLLTLSAAEG